MKDLTELDLGKNLDDRRRPITITDTGLNALKGIKQLKRLNVSGNMISDAGMKTLSGIKTLEKLNVANTKVTDAGIAKLKEALPGCLVETKDGQK
jgi:Ran GTPase-activating protein (RanGAP) involved in mRNA processing and transport